MAEETVEQEEQPAPPSRRGFILNALLIVVLAVVSSAGGGVVSFMLMTRFMPLPVAGEVQSEAKSEDERGQEIAELLEKSAVLPLEPFVVNLADPDAARYLRIQISLMVDDKSKIKEMEENQALRNKVRDVILQSLTIKTSRDLINEDGKNKLRHEIQEKIAVYFREPKLVDVMFTEFVIQL